ncbi:CHAT domain-containing protein ['Massilia aquatica' Lu et al. 2020]|uniref:CHAT domain-containing protein n=1 Tax=Pseudoduganella aquatica TaxID=2660641 RepID=A0A7X4H7Q4_9BURK|nr:CHAT domain-containing protein [Pseudoduganella aquatica]
MKADQARSVHRGRRRWLQAACTLAAAPALASAKEREELGGMQARLAQLVRPARLHLKAGRYSEAEALLAQANALIEQDPEAYWPFRPYVLPPYALSLLRQERAVAAVSMLEQALRARDRIVTECMPGFCELQSSQDEKMGMEIMRVEYGRELTAIIRTSMTIRTGEDLAMHAAMEMTELWILLAAAMRAGGMTAPLIQLYTQRVVDMSPAPSNLPLLVAHEYRLYAFGQALGQAGAHEAASDAWRRALDANTSRLRLLQRKGAPHSVFAACTMRRVLLSSRLLAEHANGQLNQRAEDKLLTILQTKLAGRRYREAAQAGIATQSPITAELLQTLEDALANTPATVTDVQPFLRLLAQHDLISSSAMWMLPPEQLGVLDADRTRLEAMQSQLAGSAAIGFMLLTDSPGINGRPGQRYYLRYCVTAQETQLDMLDQQEVIERLVHTCRTDFLRGASQSRAAAALSLKLLDGLAPSVQDAEEWLIEADGALHLLPFDALPDQDGKPLLCTHKFRVLTSLWQLLETRLPPTMRRPAVLIADPDYQQGQGPAKPDISLRWASGAIALGPVAALPETRAEVRQAARALGQIGIPSEVLLGKRATAQTLSQVRQPAVLHIASHAVLRSALDGGAGAGSNAEGAMDLLLPGRQSGLVLSRDGRPDVMLAKDVARLRLQGTALVVLSACNTANGDIAAGEGIASLRSAVEMAGAHSAVTALWQVPSAPTSSLMAAFYQRLAHGDSCGAALRAAKLGAYSKGAPAREWAGFQLSGADRALNAKL